MSGFTGQEDTAHIVCANDMVVMAVLGPIEVATRAVDLCKERYDKKRQGTDTSSIYWHLHSVPVFIAGSERALEQVVGE